MGEYLTIEQIEKFKKDGILVLDNFLSQDDVTDMRKEILKLVQDMNPEEHRGVFSTTDNNSAQVFQKMLKVPLAECSRSKSLMANG